MKALHWTQTDAGKKKMSKRMRKFWRQRRSKLANKLVVKKGEERNGKHSGGEKALDYAIKVHQAYATGRVEEFLRGYAESLGVPAAPFTDGVSRLLFATTSRVVLRPINNLSGV
jgi:hypothetical protein